MLNYVSSRKLHITLFTLVILLLFVVLKFISFESKMLLGSRSSNKLSMETTTHVSEEPLMTYSFYNVDNNVYPWYEGISGDVITPYIEKKFNIKVGKVIYNQGMSFQERFHQLLAANDLPDVIACQGQDAVSAAMSKRYAELGDLIKVNMPNLLKWCPEEQWTDALINGKMYALPRPWINTADKKYEDDIYALPPVNWGIITREDILKKLGYEFTPLVDIEKAVITNERKPTLEELAIKPAIETPEDFYEFLKRVKELGLKAEGEEVIPFSIPYWLQLHFLYMFGVTNAWNYDRDTGLVSGYLGCPYAKEGYKYLNKLYLEGLIDKDFLTDKGQHLQDKWESGVVASGMWMQNYFSVYEKLLSKNKEAMLRPINMPRKKDLKPTGIDHYSPVTFQLLIREGFEDIPRLLRYFDWFLSDEGLDLCVWGPEDTGFWKWDGGKKVFTLPNIDKDGVVRQGEPQDFGLGMTLIDGGYPCRALAAGLMLMGYHPYSVGRSKPYTVDNIFSLANTITTSFNVDYIGLNLLGVDDVSNAAGTYCWDKFINNKCALLIAAADDQEFEKYWNDIYEEFLQDSNYEAGRRIMEEQFRRRGWGN